MRNGKETLTEIQRKRARAVESRISFGNSAADVFGYEPVAADEIERLRVEERTAAFDKVVEAARRNFEEKKSKYQGVRRRTLRSMCFMGDAEKSKIDRKTAKKKTMFASRCIFGETHLSWPKLLRSLGNTGDPIIYVEPALSGGGGFLDQNLGGKPLREYIELSLNVFVSTTVAPLRRIMLVRDIVDIPLQMQLAAVFVRARVQQQIFVPLLQYSQKGPLVLSFTATFAMRHKDVVKVAKLASRRIVVSIPYPGVQVLPLVRFWNAVDKIDKKGLGQHCLIYLTEADVELQGISPTQASTARTFAEFMRALAFVQPAPLQ